MRVLVVDDNVRLANLLSRGLHGEEIAADVAHRGEEALGLATANDYDVIVLDVMMPGLNGFETCRRLRARGVWSPVMMLTARDSVDDRVEGLDSGADDYMMKPFSFAELIARLHALTRRGAIGNLAILEVGDLRLDPSAGQAWRGDADMGLTPTELALLAAFMRQPGRLLDRLQLVEQAWGTESTNRSNVVDVYVGYLRDKIDRPFRVESIETVRGAGYRLRSDAGRAPA